MEWMILGAVGVAVGIGISVLRRNRNKTVSQSDVISRFVADSRRKNTELRAIAARLRVSPEAREVFIATNTCSIAFGALLDQIERDPDDYTRAGDALHAIDSIHGSVSALCELMGQTSREKFAQQAQQTGEFLTRAQAEIMNTIERLGLEDEIKARAHRNVGGDLLGIPRSKN